MLSLRSFGAFLLDLEGSSEGALPESTSVGGCMPPRRFGSI